MSMEKLPLTHPSSGRGWGAQPPRRRLGCTGQRPADRTLFFARAPNTLRKLRALAGLNTCSMETRLADFAVH